MSTKLALIARRINLQNPEKIPVAPASDDLAAAIERLVQERVEAELARQPVKQPAHVQQLLDRQFNKPSMPTDYRELPPVQKTPAPKAMEVQFQRDELGRIALVDMGTVQWRVQRNEVGQIVRMVPSDMVSEVTYNGLPVPPPNRKA